MAPSPSPPDRLDQLRDRWRADPSSRGFLQIAEEYRRQGRVGDALSVLDEGLRQQPGYLSALVAKGRCHLELGQADAARETLEQVVRQDPTQAVANKLLVRAHLAAGQARQARERLDLYDLLQGGDPEIRELKERIAALERPAAAQAAGDVFELEPRAVPVPELLFPGEESAAPEAAPFTESVEESAEEPDPVTLAPTNGEPFPGLDTAERRALYLEGLSAEGIFFVEAAEPAPPTTVTLGQLYLEQGHAAEAREIFQEVLRREPENRAAQTALAEAGRRADTPAARPDSPAARKAQALTRYLERLRRGSARLVP